MSDPLFHPVPRTQRGATLAIVMILLVVMTLLGVVSLRMAQNQESMNASLFDRSLHFQAAEAALRQAEASINLALPKPALGTCAPDAASEGVCGFPDPNAAGVWTVAGNWAGTASRGVTVANDTLGLAPRYMIEWLADSVPADMADCTTAIDVSVTGCTGEGKRFRITAISDASDGGPGQAVVMLQSIYNVP